MSAAGTEQFSDGQALTQGTSAPLLRVTIREDGRWRFLRRSVSPLIPAS